MSENDNERYIDPNSGAAPQPGGFVAGGSQVPQAVANAVPPPEEQEPVEGPETDSDADATYEAAQEHSAAPAGDQPGGSVDPEGAVDAQPEADGGTEDSSAEAQAADAGDGGSDEETSEEDSSEEGGEGSDESEGAGEKDYSELLAQNLGPIQKYIDEHPDEKAAVQAAEIDRAGDDARKGILDY